MDAVMDANTGAAVCSELERRGLKALGVLRVYSVGDPLGAGAYGEGELVLYIDYKGRACHAVLYPDKIEKGLGWPAIP